MLSANDRHVLCESVGKVKRANQLPGCRGINPQREHGAVPAPAGTDYTPAAVHRRKAKEPILLCVGRLFAENHAAGRQPPGDEMLRGNSQYSVSGGKAYGAYAVGIVYMRYGQVEYKPST